MFVFMMFITIRSRPILTIFSPMLFSIIIHILHHPIHKHKHKQLLNDVQIT